MDRRMSAGRRRKDPEEAKASAWLAQAHQINSKRKALTKDRDMAINSMRVELDRCVGLLGLPNASMRPLPSLFGPCLVFMGVAGQKG